METFTNKRYGSNKGFKTLATKLSDDLKVLSEHYNLNPNILVISGDLAEWSLEDEYKEVRALICSLMKSEYTDFTKQRVILVPGNHDINWDLSESYFKECKAYKHTPEPPYSKKYRLWHRFLQEFYDEDTVTNRLPWRGFDLSEYGILAVALDSCIQESHRSEDHYGWLGIPQVEKASTWLEEHDPSHKHVHMAVFHHNPMRGSRNDNENLKDWDAIRPHFDKNIDLILHGHRHEAIDLN